ncbi:sodium- and chloride-dependent GABA transporter 1-like isoform X2 [Rhopilema esculentum]|uniref:sodium- and chloride-dependent GABA transporter 1-like isoform X2 n=1 Tax=Rhopilema esculentum TaxID=499914 RepID=UPI0031DDECE6
MSKGSMGNQTNKAIDAPLKSNSEAVQLSKVSLKEVKNDDAAETQENGHMGLLNSDEQIPERETWSKKIEFILASIGYAVGLGNVWRFPYLAFQNGGGAFLVPYFTMLLLCGMPLFCMELSIGQYFSLGPVTSWSALCPIAKGVGFGVLMISFLCTIYYNVLVAYVLYYMYESLKLDVPWRHCNNWWNTKNCVQDFKAFRDNAKNCKPQLNSTQSSNWTASSSDALSTVAPLTSFLENDTITNAVNLTSNVTTTCSVNLDNVNSPSKEFWERYVLQITESIGDMGEMRVELVFCLIIGWVLVYLCLFKGIKSSGKVVYFTATFPYFLMFVLLIRGATLEGASKGVSFYLKPNFSKLLDANVWVQAATQICYSLGIGFGSLITFGSYNKFENNCIRDAVSISLINCLTSVFAGFTIFCVLGHMAFKLGKNVEDVVTSGPGLVFVVYPEGIAQMPISPLWAFLFFFMILTIGLDTQFAMFEAVITGLTDEYPKYLRKYKPAFTGLLCFLCFLLGLPLVTQGGMFVLNLFNWQAGGVSLLFVALCEVLTLSYGYGAGRFIDDMEFMLGKRPSVWWKFCWKFASPLLIGGLLIFSLATWTGINYGTYKYPDWAEVIGWCLAAASILWVPGVAIYRILTTPGSLIERIRYLIKPDQNIQDRVDRVHNIKRCQAVC